MSRYVVTADVALRLGAEGVTPGAGVELVAPTLLRSQVLSSLYGEVRAGRLAADEAKRRLVHVRGLRMRLLGDKVLQDVAWKVAEQLGRDDTFDAEYVALTTLQADALVTLDEQLAEAVRGLVEVAPYEALTGGG